MGTITSGIGLISGINTTQLVDQLMAIDAKPRDLLQTQANNLDTVKAAWQDLATRLLAMKSSVGLFNNPLTFQAVAATSSNTNALTVTAQAGATPSNYNFTPVRLATNHQVVSTGVQDVNTSPVGAGTMTIDLGHGQLNPPTPLAFLNGQTGVARGKISITDRADHSATIDLTAATTVQDVLDAVNNASGIQVTASVSGDHIVLADTSGSTGHSLSVAEVGGGKTAASLGLLHSVAANSLTGDDIVSVNARTTLNSLNDGNGVRTQGGNDLAFTLEDGSGFSVSLGSAHTLGDVIAAINSNSGNGGKLLASIDPGGDGLMLQDQTGGSAGQLAVAEVGAGKAARDLGLLSSENLSDHAIHGQRVTGGLNSVLLRDLNGGSGVRAGDLTIQDRAGGSASVPLGSAQTVQDVLDAINGAAGVGVHASLNDVGNGIVVTDTSGGSSQPFVIGDTGAGTAADLHIAHNAQDTTAASGPLQPRYVSENSSLADLGVARGKFVITDSTGQQATVDLTASTVTTLGDVITQINTRGIGVAASINAAGNGLLLTDTAGGPNHLTVAEAGSTTAASLGILGTDTADTHHIDGARQMRITVSATETLQDVANAINSAPNANVSASIINDGSANAPYRLVISSKTGGQAGRMVLDAGTTGLGFTTMSRPQDALIFLGDPSDPNAIAIQSSSNTVTGVANGVTLNLVAPTTTPVNVSITASTDSMVSQLNNFVANFNSTVAKIDQDTSYDTTTNTASALQGDITAEGIRDQLFAMITDPVNGATGVAKRLIDIGFSITNNGTAIAFDPSQFQAAYAQDPAGVSSLFTLADQGVGDHIQNVLNGMTDSLTGTIQQQVSSLDSQKQMLTDRIAELNTLLASKRARMLQDFATMESTLAQLQSQSSALTGLTSLMNSLLSSSTTASTSSTTSSTSTG